MRGNPRSILFVLCAACAPAFVSAGNPPLGTFGNEAQQPVGEALQRACEYFNQNPPRDQGEQELFAVCNQMQGLPPDEIPAALQHIGTEESAATGTNATETSRGRVVLKRLAALRSGATGITVSDLRFDIDGRRVEARTLFRPGSASRSWGRASAESAAEPASAAAGEGILFPDERLGLFANGLFSFGDKDSTVREDGLDFQVPGITVGLDYRFRNDLIFGGAASYESFDGDFHTTATVSGGSAKSDRLSLTAYTTYYRNRFYLDGIFSYGQSNYEMERRIVLPFAPFSGTASSDTDGDQYELTAAFGYSLQRGAFQFAPSLRLHDLHQDVDAYVEKGAAGLDLEMAAQRIDSFVSVAGAQFSWTTNPGGNVVIPQLHAEWHHQFDDDSRALSARFVHDPTGVFFGVPTDDPDRDFYAVGGGVSAVWRGGWQAFLDLETVVGLRDVTNYAATVGIRFTL